MRLSWFLALLFACGTVPPPCTASSCSGCCEAGTSRCLLGTEAVACGAGGTACVACASGQVCDVDTKTCKATPVCDASTCAGCCDVSGTGVCNSGTTNATCGRSGSTCRVCQPGQSCVNGSCVP